MERRLDIRSVHQYWMVLLQMLAAGRRCEVSHEDSDDNAEDNDATRGRGGGRGNCVSLVNRKCFIRAEHRATKH